MASNFITDYTEYKKLAYYRRGIIIDETITLERIIDEYISKYYCSNEESSKELMEMLLCTNKITFENKMQIFKVIIDKKKDDFNSRYPTFISDILHKIIPQRNIFAHYWLDTREHLTEFLVDRKTVFIKYKNQTEYIEYDQFLFDKLTNTISKSITNFLEYTNVIPI